MSDSAEQTTPAAPEPARPGRTPRGQTRRSGRILAMQILCQIDVRGDEAADDLETLATETGGTAGAVSYAAGLIRAWQTGRAGIDACIAAESGNWSLARISIVERNILRVAVAELLGADVPPKAAINEAIEIGKEYGGADTPRFVNGVLDAVYARMKDEMGIADCE